MLLAVTTCQPMVHAAGEAPVLLQDISWDLHPAGWVEITWPAATHDLAKVTAHAMVSQGYEATPIADLRASFGPEVLLVILEPDLADTSFPYVYVVERKPMGRGSPAWAVTR